MDDTNETMDMLTYYYSRCSICLEEKFRICLSRCRDQFCIPCFTKYIAQKISESWGLSVTCIECPVCQLEIPKHEWSHYVPNQVVQDYEKFNQPYKKYKTSCSDCQSELVPCHSDSLTNPKNSALFCNIINHAIESCKQEDHSCQKYHIALKRWITVYKRQAWDGKMDILDFYHQIMNDASAFSRNHSNHGDDTAYQVSLQFTRLLTAPEMWKKLQFVHIKNFPTMQCIKCTSFVCLLCGSKAHDNSCQSNMEALLKSKNFSSVNKKTIEWKLRHCRQCPVCSIMINREEGCNKVDCPFCGYAFCWACQSPWSEGCAFYRCSTLSNSDDIQEDNAEEKTELGVPDISKIRSRFNRM